MDELPGFIAEFDRASVDHKDVSNFGSVRDDLIALTVKHGELVHLEFLVNGYDDDPRSLYEVPEVRRWIELIHAEWPDALFWLTAGSLWTFVLALHPEMHSRLPDGRLQVAIDPAALLEQLAMSNVLGQQVLLDAGMPEEHAERAGERATQNFMDMLDRKTLGDYVVLHPDSGSVVTYRTEA